MPTVVTSATFTKLLEDSLQEHIAIETEKAIEAAKAKLDRTLREALAHVALKLLKYYTIEMHREHIVITVKNEVKP